MNMHVCQSLPTISESKNIISTVENFNSSQDSKPMIGFKLDAMSGGYLLTYGVIRIPKWLFWDIMEKLDRTYVDNKIKHIKKVLEWKMVLTDSDFNTNEDIKELVASLDKEISGLEEIKALYDKAKGKEIPPLFKKLEKAKSSVSLMKQNVELAVKKYKDEHIENLLYTGHNLISIFLPDDFEYTIQNDKSPDGKPVVITRGVLLSGTLDKTAMGSSSGSLIHHLSKDYSNQRACQFISEYSRMINIWLMQQGFSVGIYDCLATDTQFINDEVNKNLLKAKAAIDGEKDPELRETNIKIALNDVSAISRKIAQKGLQPDNRMLKMVESGAKGTAFNLTQITGMVGQQNVGIERIEKQFGGRTLPHFEEHIEDIRTEFASRGYIFSSYFHGMNPTETFFAAAGGRQGLIDTAVKSVTADTPIIILENGETKYITIGEYIDSQLDNDNNKEKTKHFDEANMEYLDIKKNSTFIPTCDENGKVTWGEITAITRHDPGNELFEIKTQSGREVIVTASKSLIIWDETKQQLVPKLMKDIKVNDFVPITMNLNKPPVIKNENISIESIIKMGKECMQMNIKDTIKLLTFILQNSDEIVKKFVNSLIKENTDTIYTENKDILNLLNLVYSRVGLFLKFSNNRIIIDKNINIKNDIVLDPIVEINSISPEKYPKMYDLTIPSTLNFSLASGLIVRDTAQTGYIQRKMSKILEDLTASYVGTVNDGTQNIVQFNYGEDNLDASKLIKVGSKNDKGIFSFIDIRHTILKCNIDYEWKQYCNGIETDNINSKKRKLTKDEIHFIKDNIIAKVYEEFYTVNSNKECVQNAFSTLEPHIHNLEMYPEMIEYLQYEITRQLKQAIINSGESVGHVAASSMGEQNTQSSLNSVVGDTNIVIMINDNCIQTTIGQLIDNECNNGFETVKYNGQNDTNKEAYAEIVNLETLKNKEFKIQSIDENGKVEWRKITKFIRHPLYTKLIKVVTESGREVIATTGLSFLIKNELGKIIPIEGSKLQVGDRIPIGYKSPRIINNSINLREWLSPNDYIYGNELWTARIYRDKYRNNDLTLPSNYDYKEHGKNPGWWVIHHNKDFILPFTRADHAMKTFEGAKSVNVGKEFYKQDCIYIKGQTVSNSHIPENIELNELFGFFIGAYLSEGCCSDNYISIANYDINVLNKIQTLCDKWNIGWHHIEKGYKKYIYEENHGRIVSENSKKLEESKEPCEIRIHSKLIANWIEIVCGRGSENKRIPNFAYNAPNDFIKGMLDGLISGDGTIYEASIDYSSCSKILIHGIITILSYFGITCTTHMYQAKTNNKNSKVIKPTYTLSIVQANNERLAELLDTLTIQYKSDKLQLFKTKKFSHDIFWSRKKCEFDKKTRRNTEPESNYYNPNEDVFMDAIVSIEEVSTEDIKYVYDFEVPETGNFNLLNQMHVRDSFHSSGSFKANLTSGLSRLEELMNATKNPKSKSLTIYFDTTKVDVTNYANVRSLANIHLLSRSLNDYIKTTTIEVQPTLTSIEQVWYHTYQVFVARDDISNCKYRLRLQIDPNTLYLSKRTLYSIAKSIETVFIKGLHFYVVCSPDYLGIIDIWIEDSINDPSTFFNTKGYEAELLLEHFVNNENKMYHLIKKIILPKLKKLHISGIEGIKEVFYDKNKNDKWFIQTKGGQLKCLYYNPLIDHYRSITNDMWEVNTLFGIESSKKWLKEEFSTLLSVNHRHLDILVDKMTFAGSISAVSIYGLDRKLIGPLSKAVFERPVVCLLTAAQKSEYDSLKSISSCVATGKLGRFGTGIVDLISDNVLIMNNPYAEQYAQQAEQLLYSGEELPAIEEDDEDVITIEEPLELNEDDIY